MAAIAGRPLRFERQRGVGYTYKRGTHTMQLRGLLMGAATVVAASCALAGGCSSLERYSVRAAESSCSALSVCTVYGPNGEVLSPCTTIGRQTVYPGDPSWPYTTPGVCDAVRDGRVVSTRDDAKQ